MAKNKSDPKSTPAAELSIAVTCDRLDYLLNRTIPALQTQITAASSELSILAHGLRGALAIIDPLVDADLSGVSALSPAPRNEQIDELILVCRDLIQLRKESIERAITAAAALRVP